MPTLKPRDGVHLVRELVRAPDFAIARLLSDGKPRAPMEIYRKMGDFSFGTAVAAFGRLKRAGLAKPVLSGKKVGWVLHEDAAAVIRGLEGHQARLKGISKG